MPKQLQIKHFNSIFFFNIFYKISNIYFYETTIQVAAFKNNIDIVNFLLKQKGANIPKNCFNYYEKLRSINIPSSIDSIGTSAFYGCKSLRKIIIGEFLLF
mgnify:CR=1 FL=1